MKKDLDILEAELMLVIAYLLKAKSCPEYLDEVHARIFQAYVLSQDLKRIPKKSHLKLVKK